MSFHYAVIRKRQGWCVLRQDAQVGVYRTYEDALEVARSLGSALSGGAGSVSLDVQSPSGELRRISL